MDPLGSGQHSPLEHMSLMSEQSRVLQLYSAFILSSGSQSWRPPWSPVRVHACTSECVCMSVHGYVSVLACVYVCVWACVYACLCVSMYMCECIYACRRVHLCVFTSACIAYVHVCLYVCEPVCAFVRACMYMCARVYVCLCVSMYVRACLCVRICVHVRVQIDTLALCMCSSPPSPHEHHI